MEAPELEHTFITSALSNVSNPIRGILLDTSTYTSFSEMDNDPFFKLELNPATSMRSDFARYQNKRKPKKHVG